MTRYLTSSQRFLTMTDSLNTTSPDPARLADISSLASRELTRDMTDVQLKLTTVSDLSAGALSFLQSLNHYVSSGDEYWNKVKGLVKKVDPKEKSFLSENIASLKSQAERFNGRLTSFKEISGRESSRIASLQIYDDLAAELSTTAGKKP